MRIEPATLDELAALVGALPERLRLMPLLAAWCGLRFGELTAFQVVEPEGRERTEQREPAVLERRRFGRDVLTMRDSGM